MADPWQLVQHYSKLCLFGTNGVTLCWNYSVLVTELSDWHIADRQHTANPTL